LAGCKRFASRRPQSPRYLLSGLATLRRKQPCVCSEIQLGPVGRALDDQPREARVHLDAVYGEPGVSECSVDRRDEPVDGLSGQAEEVEVARLSLDVAAGDQRGAAREREFLGRYPKTTRAALL
jgi:hypothetical protein